MRIQRFIILFLLLFPFTAHAGSLNTKSDHWRFEPVTKQESNQSDVEAFIESIEKGDVASMERWLAAGMNADVEDGGGSPALILAIKTGRMEVVKALLDYGADVNADYKSWTALGLAAHNGRLEIVELLIERGAKINAEGDCHHTALILAAEGAMFKALTEFMLQRIPMPEDGDLGDDDPGDVRNFGSDYLEIVKTLIAKGADVNVKADCETGDWTATALVIASMSGNVELVELLLSHGADPNKETAATPLTLLTTDNEMMREEIEESDSPEEKQRKQALNDWSQSLRPAHDRIIELLRQAGARDEMPPADEGAGSNSQ